MIFKELTIAILIIVFNFIINGNASGKIEIADVSQNKKILTEHILIRRSSVNDRKKSMNITEKKRVESYSKNNGKGKEVKISGNNLKKSERKFIPTFEERCKLYDYIDDQQDLTMPVLTGDLNETILDYSVMEILDSPSGKFDLRGIRYVYMHMITPYITGKKIFQIGCEIDLLNILNGPILIMPIYRIQDYALVLIADMKNKKLIYYDPIDPYLAQKSSKIVRDRICNRFLDMIRQRNSVVPSDKRIKCDGWNINIPKISQLPIAVPKSKLTKTDYGIHALQFIDYFVNDGFLTDELQRPINMYYDGMFKKIVYLAFNK